jgi:hypothetical protein
VADRRKETTVAAKPGAEPRSHDGQGVGVLVRRGHPSSARQVSAHDDDAPPIAGGSVELIEKLRP